MLSKIKNLILDMDGVLWRGDTPMIGLPEFFETLTQLDLGYVMATNNATKTVEQYTDKFKRFGVEIEPGRILTSAEATAAHLSEHHASGTPVYIVGDKGLHTAMRLRDFEIVAADDVQKGARPDLVVLGFTPQATYNDLAMAAIVINNGAAFIGTNPDPSIPSELGPVPGAGSLLAALTTATGVEPEIVGKPGPLLFEQAIKRLGSNIADTSMVGDRLTTDIAGAKSAGLWAILVLSGIATADDIEDTPYKPDFVFADINELSTELELAFRI